MYKNEDLDRACDMPIEVRQPELITLTEQFQIAVDRFEGLTREVRTKLQNIKRYSEPEPEPEPKPKNEAQPESFVEEMRRLIFKVEEYNSRLELNLRHLNEII